QRAKSLVRKVNLNGPQTDASKRESTNRSQMPVRFIDLEEIQRELPTGVPVLIDQEAVVLNVHWPAESNTADIHAQLYGPLAAAILNTIYESLLMAEPELSYSPKIGNHHQYKHRNGTVIQEIHVLVPKGGLAKLNSSFAVQQGHLKLGLISLLPNSPPIEVEVHIRNLHKAAPVYWEITGVPPNLAPQAVPSFLAQAYSSTRNEWLKRDFQQLNPTKMANTWRVKMAPGSHSLPHEIPYSLRGSNNHRVLIATKLRMVEEEVPFTMPCPPRHAWSSNANVTYNVNNNAKCSSYNSNSSGKSKTSNSRGGNNSSNHSSNSLHQHNNSCNNSSYSSPRSILVTQDPPGLSTCRHYQAGSPVPGPHSPTSTHSTTSIPNWATPAGTNTPSTPPSTRASGSSHCSSNSGGCQEKSSRSSNHGEHSPNPQSSHSHQR
ncbi:hypothetical protein Vafri_8204, partial [Volvox africanus]